MTDERLKELEHILAGYPKSLMGPDCIKELITAIKTLKNEISELKEQNKELKIDASWANYD